MCDCQSLIEKKLTERLVQQKPEATSHKVVLKGYGLCLGKTLHFKPFMPYEQKMIVTAKNGNKREVKATGNMFFNYCPFCGEEQKAPN